MKIKNKINYKNLLETLSNHISTINDTFFETEKKVDNGDNFKMLKSGGTIFCVEMGVVLIVSILLLNLLDVIKKIVGH